MKESDIIRFTMFEHWHGISSRQGWMAINYAYGRSQLVWG